MHAAPLALLLAALLASPAQAAKPAGTSPLKNVTDAYLALPQELLGVGGPTPAERRRLIQTEDLEHGYLRLSGGDWEGHGEVALWRKADGSFLVGVALTDCGPVCEQRVRFFVEREGKLHDVTAEVWTPLAEAERRGRYEKATGKKYSPGDTPAPLLELPRKGTALGLVTQPGFGDEELPLATWAFQHGRFVLQPGP